MKKNLITLIITLLFLTVMFSDVLADEDNFGRNLKRTIQETVDEENDEGLSPKQIRREVRENFKEEVKERKEGMVEKVKNFIKKNLRFDARLICIVDSIDEVNKKLVVECDGKTYTIITSEKTKFVRKFGGKSDFSELKVDDNINVFGKFTNEDKDIVDAKLIRDLSIQKRWGVFFGEIASIGSGSFVMKTIQRGDLKVFYNNDTKLLNHKKEVIDKSNLIVGMRVRVKGVWDKTSNEVRETEEIRVFPKAVSPTPTP
jgi:hypothetical protein